jgi:cellulose synthase/poly-beta-1,6-N-acetylglucosamine synthase-like glycosyltransferase
VLGYSQYEKHKSRLNDFIRYETLLTALSYISFALLGRPYMGVGRNMAYRKALFIDNNGFGKYRNIVGGDDDLFVQMHARRSNTRVVLSADTLVYSKPKLQYSDYYWQKIRHLSVGKLYSFTDKMWLGAISLSKMLFWAMFIPAILSASYTLYVLCGFVFTMVLLLTALAILKNKSGDRVSLWAIPVLDLVFVIYYLFMAFRVLFTKKVKWS